MPYIAQFQRTHLDPHIEPLAYEINDVGELNYAITRLAILFAEKHGKSYGAINDAMGVLSCAPHEFYRRYAAPYEDEKAELNGDVYP